MSSGMDAKATSPFGVTSNLSIASGEQVLAVYNQGFQSPTDYHKFLQLVENSNDFPLKYTEPFMNTTNQDVLSSIGRSRFVAKKIKEAIDQVMDPWQPEAIKQILKVLKHVPFELSNLIDNDLGHALKSIKKTAVLKNDSDILSESTNLINEWKALQAKSINANGKRDSPDRSSNSPPASTSEPKKIRLAIQKEPPARPKAKADVNFFPALGEPKKYRVRPIYNVENNKSEATNNTTVESVLNGLDPAPVRQASLSLSPPSNKKKVTFAEKLVDIREYEKNPEEWTSFDTSGPEDIENFYASTPTDVRTQQQQQVAAQQQHHYYNIPSVTWYTPFELNFNTDENPNLVIPKHVRTPESAAQDNREKMALAAIYTSAQHIPSSPGEPDEAPNPNVDTRVIPLVDTQPIVYNNNAATQQIIDPSLITPATLNAAAAIAAAMQDPYLIPQQQQPDYQQAPASNLPAPSNSAVYNGPTSSTASISQPEISSHTVEAMLKNNPGIMQSLKQLSFLAAGNTLNNSNGIASASTSQSQANGYQPQSTSQPQSNGYQPAQQQQQYGHIPQQQNNNNDDYNNNNYNNKKRSRMNKAVRGRGTGNRGRGGGGPMRGDKSSRVCNFFNTPVGCLRGEHCPYSHDLN